MKKIILALLFAAALAIPTSAFAKSQYSTDKVNTLKKDQTVDGNYYAFGEIVEIFGTVKGDVYTAGGQVFIDGNIEGDLIVAGGTVTINGTVSEDVRAAGGQITVGAEIGKNLSIAGGNIDVNDQASVGRALHIAGGNLTVAAPIIQEVYAAGGNLTITSALADDVTASVGNLRVSSTANIAGSLNYWSEEEGLIDSSATISGNVMRHETRAGDYKPANMPSDKDISNFFRSVSYGFRVVSLAITLGIGLIILRLFPAYSNRAAQTVKERMAASLGYGFIFMIATPILLIILLVTIIGIPFALLGLVWFMVYLYLARIYALMALGRLILKKLEKGKTRSGWAFVTGAVVYYVVTMIPVLGILFKLFFILAATGALLISDKATFKLARKHNVI